MDAYDYVDTAENFLEQEANSTPVYLKLNKKMIGDDYYSLTSNESEYTYVGGMDDNRPSGFGVLKIWSIDAGGCFPDREGTETAGSPESGN